MMSSGRKTFLSLGIIWAGQCLAAAPTAFDQWAVSNGQISSDCPTGFSCSAPIDGVGFLQREIRDLSTNDAYLQTIITSKDSTGPAGDVDFADESFVFKHGLSDISTGIFGIADKQAIRNDNSAGINTKRFDSTTNVSSGWASDPGEVHFNSNQSFTESQQYPEDFSASFDLKIFDNGSGGQGYSEMDIWQDARDPGIVDGGEFESVFHYKDRKNEAGNTEGVRLAISQNIGAGYPKLLTLEDENNNRIRIETGGKISDEERQVFLVRRSNGSLSVGGDPMWIYHWQSTGLDGRKSSPLLGQWFGCRSFSLGDQCEEYSKHETLAMPNLPFDPVPFDAPVGHHSKKQDENLYDKVEGGNKVVVPGLNAGGDIAPLPTPRVLAPPVHVAGGTDLLLDWSVSNGKISVTCPSGFSCQNAITDDGFVQVTLTDRATGEVFFETIVTDRTATGSSSSLAFSNQAVIKQLPIGEQTTFSGIANSMKVSDPHHVMYNTSTIRTGWARTEGIPDMVIDQQTSYSLFDMDANMDDRGNRTGVFLDMIQYAANSKQKLDEQIFIHTEIGGDMLTQSGRADLPGGYNITWNAGDDIAVTFMTVGNDPSSAQMKDDDKDPTGNERRDWNQGWGGWRISYLFYDNYSDTKHPEGLVTPKDKPGWIFWKDDPFGTLESKIDTARAGGGLNGASSGTGFFEIQDGKGGDWTQGTTVSSGVGDGGGNCKDDYCKD